MDLYNLSVNVNRVSENLTADEANWSVFIPGLEFEDTWGPTVNTQVGDIVTYGGYTYIAKQTTVRRNVGTSE